MSQPEPVIAASDSTPPVTPVAEAPGLADAVPGRVQTAKADKVEFKSGGQIAMTIDREPYALRCPTRDEMEPLRAKLTAMQKTQAEKMSADPHEWYDPADEVVDFVKDAIDAFGDHPFLVPEDKIPAWMTSGALPNRMLNHWRTIPE